MVPHAAGPPDAALVEMARAGDRHAFACLVNRSRPMALAVVTRVLGTSDGAADAVQEAALAALVSLERLRDPERFGAWFTGIALNVARRWRRELVALSPAPVDRPADDAGPDARAEAAVVARDVQQAVAALPPGQRQAVLAFYWGDRSHLEAAAALGITAGAVKARLHQARSNLRPLLARHAHEIPGPITKEAAMPGAAHPTEAAPIWVPVEVADIRRSEGDDPARRLHVVVLGETGGDRRLPIFVGAAEATALACALESLQSSRPLTYAMAGALVGAAGARVVDVRITTLAERTFYAVIAVEGTGGRAEVDARPSDALNLALVCDVPILVEAALFTDASPGEDRWRAAWRAFPSASSSMATEVQARLDELAALRCEEPPGGP